MTMNRQNIITRPQSGARIIILDTGLALSSSTRGSHSHLQIREEIDVVCRGDFKKLANTREVVENHSEVLTLMKLVKMFGHRRQDLGVGHFPGHDDHKLVY